MNSSPSALRLFCSRSRAVIEKCRQPQPAVKAMSTPQASTGKAKSEPRRVEGRGPAYSRPRSLERGEIVRTPSVRISDLVVALGALLRPLDRLLRRLRPADRLGDHV